MININRDSKAQATIENLLVFTAVIIVVIIVALSKNNSFQTSLNSTLQERAKWMEGSTFQLEGSNEVEPTLGP